MKRKWISLALALTLSLGAVGCSSTNSGSIKKDKDKDSEETTKIESTTDSSSSSNSASNVVVKVPDNSFLTNLSNNYAALDLNASYTEPVYQLPKDYVFEFEASDEAGYIAYDAFDVYMYNDLDMIQPSFGTCTYEDGKIYVAPNSPIQVTADGSQNVSDGTWGSLTKLYLVQRIDLDTGDYLDDPIITPFSVMHDLDAPAVIQTVDEGNLYSLYWNAIPGASAYRIYRDIGMGAYIFECETTNTSVNVEEFASTKEHEMYEDLVKQDLINAGYIVDEEGYMFMNSAIKDSYVVVAVNGAIQSGLSNVCNTEDIVNRLPYQVAGNITMDITTPMDAPTYADVIMKDGSTTKMLINYHGAQAYKDPNDPNSIMINAHIYNTLFDGFFITLNGVNYDEFVAAVPDIHTRQDSLNVSGAEEIGFIIPQAPSNDPSDDDTGEIIEDVIGEIPTLTEESTDDPIVDPGTDETTAETTEETTVETTAETEETTVETTETQTQTQTPSTAIQGTDVNLGKVTPEGYTTVELYYEVANQVDERIAQIPDIDEVFFANDQLEAWLAYCLITNQEVIPVPTAIYPESADGDYLLEHFVEAYRQNPTSGMVADFKYSFDFESIVVSYREDWNTRLTKTNQEIAAAKQIASTITGTTEVEKVYQISDYLCANASYDFDSMSTGVNGIAMNEQYIDAHTPYGIICKNFGVCESYAEAFALIARFCGIHNAMMEIGTLNGGGHEWNKVMINGQWYVVDVTNNDIDNCPNTLLCISDEQASAMIIAEPHMAYIGSLNAVDTSLDYYKNLGMVASTADEAVAILVSQLEAGNTMVYCRVPADFTMDDIGNIFYATCDTATYVNGTRISVVNLVTNVICIEVS